MPSQQFQYEIQGYQEDCINNIVSIFQKLQQSTDFGAILGEHGDRNKYSFAVQNESKNIDIMMETGTGKTFTFIKTIFELSKNFGYNKFIVLIPTDPIRQGTKINLEDTREYFKSLYANEKNKVIETFVYEKGNISIIRNFINSSNLSVLVMTPDSFNSKINILNRPLEKEINVPELFVTDQGQPKSYLECLKRLNPIVIMDEPHRFEGNAFKTYFDGFDNYYLRFGATFPKLPKENIKNTENTQSKEVKKKTVTPLSNVAYILDSITSFRQNLVKKIVVYTQDVSTSGDTLMAIQKEGSKYQATVNTYINGVNVKRQLKEGSVFNNQSIKKINRDSLVLVDDTIEKVDYTLSDESLRSMIAQTLKIHFEKEWVLFEQGIKTLTLFFIPSDISLYRGDNPKVRIIFEQEYCNQRTKVLEGLDTSSNYYQYLQKDFDSENTLQVHKGYFSGDKGNSDEKVKAGVDEILRDKKKLLSFESSTRFVFSIWALQEGWDNPNVFTICKLSNQGSEISKLQQIGRGLRICVNQNLQRQTMAHLDNDQEKFWAINNLDVMVSSKEQGFVEAIQSEILSNSFLIAETFTEQELKIMLKEKGKLDDLTIRKLYKIIENNELIIYKATVNGIDVFQKSPDFKTLLQNQDLPEEQKLMLANLFATDANTYIQKAEDKKTKKKIFIKPTYLQEFQYLWNTINKNAFYVLEGLSLDQETQLIQNIKTTIQNLDIQKILLQTTRADLNINTLDRPDAVTKQILNTSTFQTNLDYLELIRVISASTKTPLAFVVKIFNALNEDFRNTMISNNPEQAQNEIKKIISNHLIETIKLNLKYDSVAGTAMPNVFLTEGDKSYLSAGSVGKYQKDIDTDFDLKSKWVFEEVIEYDSDFELNIVKEDPQISGIKIFGKLPRLKIKTPLGEYNPDFCYIIEKQDGNKIILVVEAKGYDTSTDIPESEKAKIQFAKKYFDYLQSLSPNITISFQERINKTQLSTLIHNL